MALEGEVDPDQKRARRPPGGIAVFLTCGADLVGVRGRKLCGGRGAGMQDFRLARLGWSRLIQRRLKR